MLVIRDEQLQTLARPAVDDRIGAIAGYVRALIPGLVGGWPEGTLRGEIEARLGDAEFCGFTTDYNIVTYMVGALLMGDAWLVTDPHAKLALFDPIDDQTTRADRLDARLAEIAGDRIVPWPAHGNPAHRNPTR